MMRNVILFSFFFFGSVVICKSQNNVKNKEVILIKNEVKDDSVKQQINSNQIFTEGTITTPEEQGFTKEIINGKDVYTKEEGQIKLQYIPKK
ncbi:MAG: hypothetical protein Q7W45_15550 [Bacteroidota bacterium]|nr:hypothetical protein [Bacteroidota bacterium]MDP3145570.1 hypothetical protein [Bacteroidota bacterium]MDP3557775.1 hypothetical protein [Bacteroidota bacterium]